MHSEYTRLLSLIEGEIAACLPELPDEAWFRRFFGALPAPVAESVARGLNAPALELIRRGGKRWRPLLLVLAARAFGRGDGALALSPLVEIAHNGTLIVDDIEDGSELRRGGPAIHLVFGTDLAVNGANLLYFLPLALIDSLDAPPATRLELHARYALHMRRLHLGQAMDIMWHKDDGYLPSVDEYLSMCALKTGVLARAAAELGAIAAGAGAEAASALGAAFESVGVAFQILDDAKNLRTGLPGKARGDDIVEGKKSLPYILACEAEPRVRGDLARCFEAARRRGVHASEVEEAIGIIERQGAVDKSLARARRLLEGSKAGLASIVPPGPGLAALEGFFAVLDA